MAKAEIKSGIIDPSKEEVESLTGKGAKEGLIPWISPEAKAAMGAVLGLGCTACSGALIWELVHRPAITEEISAAQIPPRPELLVPPEKAPDDFERFRVQVEAPETEIVPKPEAITSLNLNYTIRPGDTLSEITQRFGTTQDEILTLNPEIKDSSLIHPGEELVIPEISVEKTFGFLQGLEEKVEDIYSRRRTWFELKKYRVEDGDTLWDIAQRIGRTPNEIYQLNFWKISDPNLIFPGEELFLPESIYPSEATKEIFTKIENDIEKMQILFDAFGSESSVTKHLAREIWAYWNTVPGEKETVLEPKIDVDPASGEKGKWIAKQIKEVFEALPDSGRAVAEVFIIPRDNLPDWPFYMGVTTHKGKGAFIWILEPPPPNSFDEEWEWTKGKLLTLFAHEFLGHAISLYGEGYILRFLTPAEVVDLMHEETVLWDQIYRPSGEERVSTSSDEDEQNSSFASHFFEGDEATFEYLNPEIVKGFEDHFNRVYSKVLGYPVTLDELAHRLRIR